jgi:hypothetical protein
MTRYRKTLLLFCLFFLVVLTGCEIDTRIAVSSENPPKFTFSGSGGIHRLFISGPYSQEEINLLMNDESLSVEQLKAGVPGDRNLWELDPTNVRTNLSNIPPITYGIVSKEFSQVYPKDNENPSPLQEGKFYIAAAPSYSANSLRTVFRIQDNKAVTISVKR